MISDTFTAKIMIPGKGSFKGPLNNDICCFLSVPFVTVFLSDIFLKESFHQFSQCGIFPSTGRSYKMCSPHREQVQSYRGTPDTFVSLQLRKYFIFISACSCQENTTVLLLSAFLVASLLKQVIYFFSSTTGCFSSFLGAQAEIMSHFQLINKQDIADSQKRHFYPHISITGHSEEQRHFVVILFDYF